MSQVIKKSEHTFICGSTGCGKTVLANCYLSNTNQRVFVLDTKGTFSWFRDFDKKTTYFTRDINNLYKKNLGKKVNKIIYRSTGPQLTIPNLNLFFEHIYNLGDCFVYIDEIAQCCVNPLKYPVYMKYLLQQGRELGISVWASTQRPRDIFKGFMTESTHYFIFRLNSVDDRIKVAKDCSNDTFRDKLHGHYFYYWRGDKDVEPVTSILKI